MWNFRRVEIHVSGAEFHGLFHSVFLNVNFDISFQLIKEFFRFVIVIVLSGIWPRYDHYDIIICVLIKVFVPHRRFKRITIFFYPLVEVERR
jgi:hypothetical protein